MVFISANYHLKQLACSMFNSFFEEFGLDENQEN